MKTFREFIVLGAVWRKTGFDGQHEGCVGFCPVFSSREAAEKAFPDLLIEEVEREIED
jgi:hypothetical protein